MDEIPVNEFSSIAKNVWRSSIRSNSDEKMILRHLQEEEAEFKRQMKFLGAQD